MYCFYMSLASLIKKQNVFICVCVCAQEFGSLLSPFGFQALNLGHQAWWQASLYTEPSSQPYPLCLTSHVLQL